MEVEKFKFTYPQSQTKKNYLGITVMHLNL